MRSNSGKDESRNNLHDPTLRDKELGRDLDDKTRQRTTGMGSGRGEREETREKAS